MQHTVVVPVDFSAASLNAANYAVDFAIAINANLALVHVCNFLVITEMPVAAENITQLIEDAEGNIKKLKEGLDHKTGNKISISTEVRKGTVITELEEYCQDIQPVMVIMGAHVT